MSDYRVVVKVQNGRIYERIRLGGFKTIAEFCRAKSLRQTDVGKILNLKISPVNKDGTFRLTVLRLADALQDDPVDLFTERQYEAVPSNVRDFLVEEHHLAQLLDNTKGQPGYRLALTEMAGGIQQRAKLTNREQSVIDMRFKNDMTLAEIGKVFNVTANRIRQIEEKALRKMRSSKAVADVEFSDLEN